ncbi:hypothetical protein [Paracoccus salsus]|uniref:hypothetical protein n=1 Tax=Paracoccus salsus TaxID=2911061 RepID=UPI001F15AA2C|nr:hypothetical protein [Paracoccus salsus]MCF3975048.1 hypothetical protein [Paracoccus salsus]
MNAFSFGASAGSALLCAGGAQWSFTAASHAARAAQLEKFVLRRYNAYSFKTKEMFLWLSRLSAALSSH